MPIEAEPNASSNAIRLEGPIDITSAAELKSALLEGIARGGTLHLSLEAVTCLDVTALQLLWAAERAARQKGVRLELDGPLPPAVSDRLAAAGFSGFPIG